MNVNATCSEGQTPLHWAADKGLASFVELFLRKSAGLDTQDFNGNTPLHMAVMAADSKDGYKFKRVMAQLVAGNADQMNVRNKRWKVTKGGFTPFEWVIKNGPDWAMRILAERQPITDVMQTGATALHHAIITDSGLDTIWMLLQEGAKVDIQDYGQKTALMLAAEQGREGEVHALLKFGANLNIQDAEGKTAKDIAEERDHEGVMDIMEHHLMSQQNVGT